MLYEKIPNAPRSNFIVPPQLKDSHARNGMISLQAQIILLHLILLLLQKSILYHLKKEKVTRNLEVRKNGNQRKRKLLPRRKDHLINRLEAENLVIHA